MQLNLVFSVLKTKSSQNDHCGNEVNEHMEFTKTNKSFTLKL